MKDKPSIVLVMAEHHKSLLDTFTEWKDHFAIDLQCFEKKFRDLQQKFVRWNSRKLNERSIYLTTSNVDKWKKLSSSKKAEHSLMECHGCAHGNNYEQSLFPVKSKQFKSCLQDNVFFAARKSVQEVLEQPTVNRCTKRGPLRRQANSDTPAELLWEDCAFVTIFISWFSE